MNKCQIVGNLTRDPELRSTQSGIAVCTFTVAVNRRNQGAKAEQQADFFRVTAWRGLGETCSKFLSKGRKVAVCGSVAAVPYTAQDGTARASLELTADDVEFLSPKGEPQEQHAQYAAAPKTDAQTGFVQVESDELPF